MQHSNDERRMLADAVAGFAREALGVTRARQLKRGAGGLDRAAWAEMAGLGWLSILVPESAGGLGLGVGELAVVAEGLGGNCAPEPLAAHAFGQAVLAGCDNASLASPLLGATATGERLAAVAWQGATAATTTAGVTDRVDNGVLRGMRRLVVPAEADVFVVAARDDDGIALYRVTRDAPGLRVSEQTQVDGSAALTLEFDGVAATEDDRLAAGTTGEFAFARGMCVARVAASAELLGLADALFAMTADYLAARKQFGQPLSSFQVLRHRAVDLYIQRELMRSALRAAVRAFDEDAALPDLQRAAARAKARCADAALAIGRQAVQMHGAIGYTEEADVGVYLRRILSLSAWLGSASAQRREYARLARSAA